MAEGQGFEPWVGFHLRRFSRPVLSTAQPSLRKAQIIQGFSPCTSAPSRNYVSFVLRRRLLLQPGSGRVDRWPRADSLWADRPRLGAVPCPAVWATAFRDDWSAPSPHRQEIGRAH